MDPLEDGRDSGRKVCGDLVVAIGSAELRKVSGSLSLTCYGDYQVMSTRATLLCETKPLITPGNSVCRLSG